MHRKRLRNHNGHFLTESDEQHFVNNESQLARPDIFALPVHHEPPSKVEPSFISIPPEPAEIAHGCLLIPVVAAFWWYYTKRTAQRVFGRIMPNMECTTPSAPLGADTEDESLSKGKVRIRNEDAFCSWDEVKQNEIHDSSLRFVRWIKGKNHKAKNRIDTVSKRIIHRRKDSQGRKASPLLSHSLPNVSLHDEKISTVESVGWYRIQDADGVAIYTTEISNADSRPNSTSVGEPIAPEYEMMPLT